MRKKVFQKTLTSIRTNVLTWEAELNKRLDKKVILKIKDLIFNARHIQRPAVPATTLIRRAYSKLFNPESWKQKTT